MTVHKKYEIAHSDIQKCYHHRFTETCMFRPKVTCICRNIKPQLFFGWTGSYDHENILLLTAKPCSSQCCTSVSIMNPEYTHRQRSCFYCPCAIDDR